MCQQIGFALRRFRGQQYEVGDTFPDRLDRSRAGIGANDLAALQLAREPRQGRRVAVSGVDGENQGHGSDGKLISYKITT